MLKATDFFFLTARNKDEAPIFSELLAELGKRVPVNIAASFVTAPLLAYMMANVIPALRVWSWLAVVFVLQLLSILIVVAFRRRGQVNAEPNNKWMYLLGATIVMDGIAWGLAGVFLFTEQYPAYEMLLCLFLCCASTAATITFSPWLAANIGFVVVNTAPTVWMLSQSSEKFYHLLALAGFVYFWVIIAFAGASNRTSVRLTRLHLDNQRLLEDLSISHTKLEETNKALQKKNTDLQVAVDQISAMATRDELTGCYNRRYLMKFLTKEKARSDRTQTAFSVAIIDLDYFKRVNDTYGHFVGDDVLKQVVALIQAHIRGSDCLARFGGEEFAWVYTLTRMEDAHQSADRIRKELSATPIACGDLSIYISISVGLAEYRQGETVADLLRRADQALYIAKSGGRDRVIANS
ncbi:MAG: diguanylate cyclase, partial [Burkholderiales bacterium]